MKKLLIFLTLMLAAYYVATHYFGFVGPKVVSNAQEAERIVQP